MQMMALRHWAILLLTAVLLGSSFVQIKIALETLHPLTVATARAAIAAPLVWGFLRLNGERLPPFGKAWVPLSIVGVLGAAIPFTAIAWGQERIASGLGGILFGTIPILSVVLAPLLARDERFTALRLGGAALGLIGVVVVTGSGAFNGNASLAGIAVTLLAALSYTLSAIYARRQQQVSPVVLAAGQLLVATLLLLPFGFNIILSTADFPGVVPVAAVLGAAIFSTAIPVVLLFWLVREVGATNASLTALFIPVVAVVLGTLLLGEALSWERMLGLLLIFAGAIVVSRRSRRQSDRQERCGPSPTISELSN